MAIFHIGVMSNFAICKNKILEIKPTLTKNAFLKMSTFDI